MADSKIKISELDEALQLSDNAEFPYQQDNGGVPTTFKAPANQIARKVAEGSTFTNLTTTAKTLVGAINELKALGSPIILGTTSPTAQQGADGNIYVQYTEGTGGAPDTVDSIYAKIGGAWCEIETGGGGGSGGHTIVDDSGTALTQRTNLQFNGAYSEDNSTDDTTEINVVRSMTKAEFNQLSAGEKVGFINITDETSQINATEIPIQSGSSTNTKSYIDDLKVERQYYTGTTTAYGNIDLGGQFDYQNKVIVSATVREKNNTNNIHLADIYQNNTNTFGATYGLHIRKITDNSAVGNTVVEGYIWLVKFESV